MCGIVGMVSKVSTGFYHTDLDLFESMLVCDSVRGEDSTGVFGVYKNRQARTIKVAAEPHMLFRCDEWKDFKTKAVNSMNMLVGHNRSATRGAINSDNAHPFTEGKIVLVHNGTLHNHKDFNKEVEVDSHAIAHALNERPAEEVIKEIDGAFTFIWYDREQAKLFMVRNSERPLAYIEDTSRIYFASEAPMLEWLVNRKSYSTKKLEAKVVPTNTLYSIDGYGKIEGKEVEVYRPKYQGVVKTSSLVTTPYMAKTLTWQSGQKPTECTASSYNPNRIPNQTDVVVKLTMIDDDNLNRGIKVRGYLKMPNHPMTDIVGYLDPSLTMEDAKALIKAEYAQGTVTSHMSSSCGSSYWVKGITYTTDIHTYNTTMPVLTFDHLVKHNTCDKCGSTITRKEADFTSIKKRGNTDRYRLVCSHCVMEAVDEATTPSSIFKDSDNDVQKGESQFKATSNYPFSSAGQESFTC